MISDYDTMTCALILASLGAWASLLWRGIDNYEHDGVRYKREAIIVRWIARGFWISAALVAIEHAT